MTVYTDNKRTPALRQLSQYFDLRYATEASVINNLRSICQANTGVYYHEFNNLFAISNPRNVAPFAKGELVDMNVSWDT